MARNSKSPNRSMKVPTPRAPTKGAGEIRTTHQTIKKLNPIERSKKNEAAFGRKPKVVR